MSASMRNFMEAYEAVHNKEVRDEFYKNQDELSSMNIGRLTDNDLREISEQICEHLFSEGVSVSDAEFIISELFSESEIVGRQKKAERILDAFAEAFKRIKSKSTDVALESFARYRNNKKLQETWSVRFNQEKRVQRAHGTSVADEVAAVKSGLLSMINEITASMGRRAKEYNRKKEQDAHMARQKAHQDKMKNDPEYAAKRRKIDAAASSRMGKGNPRYDASAAGSSRVKGFKFTPTEEVENVEEVYKGKHGQSEKDYQDSRSDAGKMVSGDSKMSGSAYSSRATSSTGPNPAGGSKKPKGQGRMTSGARTELQFRKAALKNKSMKEAWADAYKAVYEVDEAAKPDYLDFDKDGNKKESMKKALKDKKMKGEPKEEFDAFDAVLEYLQVEGIAESFEDAQWMMVNVLDEEDINSILDEARRSDKEGYARGTTENPKRKDIPHGDPSQRSMLHSKLKRRADEMGRERRSSARNQAGGRTPVSKKEKGFLQAADRTRQYVHNPNVPKTGSHSKF